MSSEESKMQKRNIADEMRESYLDYAMSVIVARALPDVRDGLKPVHRRILYAMKEMGLSHQAKFRKSAKVVGEVLGQYHPHGDMSVYDAITRMVQPFSLRYPLLEGQGNFGSIDGDSSAAMRYTEVKMSSLADEMLKDIDKETVTFIPNYDSTKDEPTVLPVSFPQLLLNGSLGIAVGMATNIPPHNLSEVIDAAVYLIDNPKANIEDLVQYIKGPDFPTGGLVFSQKDLLEAYTQSRGGVVTRGEAEVIEKQKGHAQVHITSIPYQVNKAELIKKIAELVRDKRIDGIRDIRDESDRKGLSIVIDLKTDAYPQKVLNVLYKHTDLEKAFHFNMIALVDGIQPRQLSLKGLLEEFVSARQEFVEKRTRFNLGVAKKRVHILEGLSKALDHIDAVIKTIKGSRDREDASVELRKKFGLSQEQATAILDMRLATLAGLERKKIVDELKEKRLLVQELESLLGSSKKLLSLIKKELLDLKNRFGDERRTKIVKTPARAISVEDMIPEEEHIMIMTAGGYLKRVRPAEYRAQRRGGRGLMGSGEEDSITEFVRAGTHDDLLFFSTKGKVYNTKMYEIPETSRVAKGKSAANFLALGPNETITSVFALSKKNKGSEDASLVMVTKKGIIKKIKASLFRDVRRSGIIALALKKHDTLGWVRLVEKGDEVMLFTRKGLALRFLESNLRLMGRNAAGVRGIRLKSEDYLVDCEVIAKQHRGGDLLVISELGFGKQSSLKEFKTQKRGGVGIKAMNVSSKTGNMVKASTVKDAEEFIAVSKKGKTIRSAIKGIPVLGRATQGVRIMKLESGDKLYSMTLM